MQEEKEGEGKKKKAARTSTLSAYGVETEQTHGRRRSLHFI